MGFRCFGCGFSSTYGTLVWSLILCLSFMKVLPSATFCKPSIISYYSCLMFSLTRTSCLKNICIVSSLVLSVSPGAWWLKHSTSATFIHLREGAKRNNRKDMPSCQIRSCSCKSKKEILNKHSLARYELPNLPELTIDNVFLLLCF